MQLKPFRGNTQGPIPEFLREVYKWALSMMSHASRHAQGGADEIDGDTIDIDFEPANYTPTDDDLAGHLEGIDDALTGGAPAAHASTHIHGGSDIVDGDRLDVDFVPANYTRTPGSNGTVDDDELTSHLKGIDNKLGGTFSPSAHASSHIHGGSDAIDGDRLDVDYVPTNYARNPGSAGTVDNDELTSHLEGIDDALAKAKVTTYSGRLTTGANSASTTFYLIAYGEATSRTVIGDGQMVWGRDGTIRNLRCKHITGGATAATFSLTININGSDTAVTVSMVDNDTSLVSDTTHTAAISVGDVLTITKTNGGAATGTNDLSWSFDFVEPTP